MPKDDWERTRNLKIVRRAIQPDVFVFADLSSDGREAEAGPARRGQEERDSTATSAQATLKVHSAPWQSR